MSQMGQFHTCKKEHKHKKGNCKSVITFNQEIWLKKHLGYNKEQQSNSRQQHRQIKLETFLTKLKQF